MLMIIVCLVSSNGRPLLLTGKRSKTLNEEIAECNTQKVSKRSMRKCWFRAAGLQKNTKTNRSHAGKFTKFGFQCSVPVQNSCLWTSVYTFAHGFCVTLHQSTAFPWYASPLLLWQSKKTPLNHSAVLIWSLDLASTRSNEHYGHDHHCSDGRHRHHCHHRYHGCHSPRAK